MKFSLKNKIMNYALAVAGVLGLHGCSNEPPNIPYSSQQTDASYKEIEYMASVAHKAGRPRISTDQALAYISNKKLEIIWNDVSQKPSKVVNSTDCATLAAVKKIAEEKVPSSPEVLNFVIAQGTAEGMLKDFGCRQG